MSTLPVTVLSGFLGVGKATLLNPTGTTVKAKKGTAIAEVALVTLGH